MQALSGYIPNQTRAGYKPNPADPRTSIPISNFASTMEGFKDVIKILHPCGEYDLECCKVPDGLFGTTVAFERRDEFEIPSVLANQDKYKSWSLIIVHLPLLSRRDFIVRYNNLVTFNDAQLNYIVAHGITKLGGAYYPNFLPLNKVDNFDPTITKPAFTDSQLLNTEVCILRPDIALLGTNNVSSLARGIRRSCLGYTTELDASDLYNEGFIVSGQWSPNITLGTHLTRDSTGTVTGDYDVYELEIPALNVTSITQSDNYRRQAEFKYGSYMPIRVCDSLALTSSVEERPILVKDTTDNLIAVPDIAVSDIWLRGWAIGVEHIKNLNPHSQVRMKVVEDLELIPAPKSTFSPFASPAHPDDYKAMYNIKEFSRKEPHAYDADFNRLNKMMGNIIRFVGNTLGSANIPILSGLAKPLANFIANKIDSKPTYNSNIPLD